MGMVLSFDPSAENFCLRQTICFHKPFPTILHILLSGLRRRTGPRFTPAAASRATRFASLADHPKRSS